MNKNVKDILDGVIEIVYFMRGAIQYEHSLLSMTHIERQQIQQFLAKRMEIESQRPNPQY